MHSVPKQGSLSLFPCSLPFNLLSCHRRNTDRLTDSLRPTPSPENRASESTLQNRIHRKPYQPSQAKPGQARPGQAYYSLPPFIPPSLLPSPVKQEKKATSQPAARPITLHPTSSSYLLWSSLSSLHSPHYPPHSWSPAPSSPYYSSPSSRPSPPPTPAVQPPYSLSH